MPVHAFVGSDDLRKHETLEAELLRWEAAEEGASVRETHFGEELNPALVAESYQTADLFAPRKALVLRNYDKIPEAGRKILERAFQAENPQVAVFLAAEKLDGRSAWAKSLKDAGRLREFRLPYDNEIPEWLAARARQRYGRQLGPSEARLLHDLVGGATPDLDHELEKLDTFLPQEAPITAEAIHGLASPLKAYAFFAFQNALGHGRLRDFLPALRNLMAVEYDSPVPVVTRLFSHFLTLAKVRALLDQGAGETEIQEACRLNHFIHIKREKYLEQARSRPLVRWKQLLARLARLEWEVKQGRYAHRFEQEMAFAQMVR